MSTTNTQEPGFRKLWGYAFDPSLSNNPDFASLNKLCFKVKWADYVSVGPVGEYLEIIDYDPASNTFYAPLDLDDKYLIANEGLTPSESNPQFHQQMVYAVAMTTIQNFEKALGRYIIWAPKNNIFQQGNYVQKLRIYPHALREANAFYDPGKKAILFGYFNATDENNGQQLPEGLVFTCLSHDIIAHEITHAILDGINNKLIDDSNPDILAFHEAFSDIIALFQHFSFEEVLKHQIAKTKGDLRKQNLLGELAQQFGQAIGQYGSLRDALGGVNPDTKEWEPNIPNPTDYATTMEPHARGAILVAAIFDTFIKIYKKRVQDLIRIASNGTGILPDGELHPDLVSRLAKEAAKSARHVLTMCIRAIDFLPPVDINFGDFLRAMITADIEMVPEDEMNYRIMLIESFRQRGIFPENVKTLSVESLAWTKVNKEFPGLESKLNHIIQLINDYQLQNHTSFKDRLHYFEAHNSFREILHNRFYEKFEYNSDFENLTGLIFGNDFKSSKINASTTYPHFPSFFVQSLALNRRVDMDGNIKNQAIVSIIQKRNYEEGKVFYGGTTLIFDMDKFELIYSIKKAIKDDIRLEQNKMYQTGAGKSYISRAKSYQMDRASFFGPFASLHAGH